MSRLRTRVDLAGSLSKLAPSLDRMGSLHWSIRGRRTQPRPLEPRARKLPRVSEEMLVRADARYAAGATLREIAKELRLRRERLASLLRTRGVRLRRATPSDKEVREMVRRYESGESLDRVGSCLGFSAGTVRNHRLRAGTVLRDTHGR